jgi:hypothetical protein
MSSGNSRRRQANIAWLSASTVFVTMAATAYRSGALRAGNGMQPPWQAVAGFVLVAVAVVRWYFLSSMDPDGRVPLRRRLAALPLTGCLAAALSALLGAKAVYVAATFGMDARNGWRIAETLLFAALAIVAWRRWKRRRS